MTVALYFIPCQGMLRLALYLTAYLIIGYDILRKACLGIIHGHVFDENFLMSTASLGAFALAICDGNGEYSEAVAVMLFYQIGEFFQGYAVGRSRRSIAALMDIRPNYANVVRNGAIDKVEPEEVTVGETIIVYPGEKIPIDGIVIDGSSTVDTSALTGESIPAEITPGKDVANGCINLSGVLTIRTTKDYEDSTVSQILELVEDSVSHKAKTESFITRFARLYTPVVCYFALALAILPPLYGILICGANADSALFYTWIYRALTFLVISCPCALVVSIPLSFFAAIGGASRQGILIKGADTIEALSKVRNMAFDKTGTLTQGIFSVKDIYPQDISVDRLLYYASAVEASSTHPIAQSIVKAYGKDLSACIVSDIREHSGLGLTAKVDGLDIAVGNMSLMKTLGIHDRENRSADTVVYVAIAGKYAGAITLGDTIKPNSSNAMAALHDDGIAKIAMLTGDNPAVAEIVAHTLNIDTVYSGLLPADKVTALRQFMEQCSGKTAYVGDGINDAPVITVADVGFAMGALGSDAAVEAADIVIIDDDIMKIDKAVRISHKCMAIVWQNIVMAIGIKAICLILGACGIVNLWLAIFADVGVLIIAVLNAMRCLFRRKDFVPFAK